MTKILSLLGVMLSLLVGNVSIAATSPGYITGKRSTVIVLSTTNGGEAFDVGLICGKTYVLYSHDDLTNLTLPLAKPGCLIRFANRLGGGAGTKVSIIPRAGETIAYSTADADDALTSQAVGDTMVLLATKAKRWNVVSTLGSWSIVVLP